MASVEGPAAAAGDRSAAYATFAHYLPLISFESQPGVGLGIRKELLRRRGVITDGFARVGAAPSAQVCGELSEVLDALALRPSAEPLVPMNSPAEIGSSCRM